MANTTMGSQKKGDTSDILGSLSPRNVRSNATESLAAFTVIPNAKIPDLQDTRVDDREERQANLLKRPKHKELCRDEANIT